MIYHASNSLPASLFCIGHSLFDCNFEEKNEVYVDFFQIGTKMYHAKCKSAKSHGIGKLWFINTKTAMFVNYRKGSFQGIQISFK